MDWQDQAIAHLEAVRRLIEAQKESYTFAGCAIQEVEALKVYVLEVFPRSGSISADC
jgi:hypothetical protein